MARASALQAEGRRFDSVYLHNEKDFGFPEVFFWFYLQSADIVTASGILAQRKIPVDLHFIVSLRHKASGAALGLNCAVCFEQPTGVFAGCGAVCFIRHIILYRRRTEVPAETDLRWRSSLRLSPAPPIYEVMGDHGSPPEPPVASISTWSKGLWESARPLFVMH